MIGLVHITLLILALKSELIPTIGVLKNIVRLTCPSGYILHNAKCIARCLVECPDNSECYGADKCRCKNGYVPNKKLKKCEPHCPGGCTEHDSCISPNLCACDSGYKSENQKCVPKCTPPCGENFKCVDENVCQCAKGFIYQQGKCRPQCNNCSENEYCKAPNQCACKKGYNESKKNLITQCEPECTPECGDHAFCLQPGICACIPGYSEDENGKCTPKCQAFCGPNEYCAGVEQCDCVAGFERQNSTGKCNPSCNPKCHLNAECIAPDTCRCIEGYTTNGTICLPHCNKRCPRHSTCMAPDMCACEAGYTMIDGDKECEPICNDDCEAENAYCHAPNECHCKEFFHPDYDIHNKLHCTAMCETRTTSGDCIPKCTLPDCGHNEYCAGYQQCECIDGFRRSNLTNRCEPYCEPKCSAHASECVEPNVCQCKAGYISRGLDCIPNCSKGCGAHAHCVAPELCKCEQGYVRLPDSDSNSECQPICTSPCLSNAHCISYNECRCNEGYFNSSNNCLPTCTPNCGPNAQCTALNLCTCHYNYHKINGQCEPICQPECGNNAVCIAPGICKCINGQTFEAINPKSICNVTKDYSTYIDCYNDHQILFVQFKLACGSSSSFLIYLIYGSIVGILLVGGYTAYKAYRKVSKMCFKKTVSNAAHDFVITYQPCSTNELDNTAANMELSYHERPPPYAEEKSSNLLLL